MKKINLKDYTTFLISLIPAIFWYIWLIKKGIALSPDSGNYLYSSLFIFNHFDLSALRTQWPPGYPLLIAVMEFLHLSPAVSAILVAAISLFFVIYFVNKILDFFEFEYGVYLRIFAVALLIFNINFIYIYQYAWSENLFTAFSLAIVYFLMKHYKTDHFKNLIFVSILVSLTALTRYLGYYAICLFALYVFFIRAIDKKLFTFSSLKYYLLVIVSTIPSVLWVIRNYLKDKTFHGPRTPSPWGASINIERFINTITGDNQAILFLCLFAIFLFLYSMLIKKQFSDLKQYIPICIPVFSMCIYVGLTIYSATVSYFDPLDTRFFAPIYPFLIIFLFWIIGFVLHLTRPRVIKKIFIAGFIALGFQALVVEANSFKDFIFKKYNPYIYTELGYYDSSLFKDTRAWFSKILAQNRSVINLYLFADYFYTEENFVRRAMARVVLYRDRHFDKYQTSFKATDQHKLHLLLKDNHEIEYQLIYHPKYFLDEQSYENIIHHGYIAILDDTRFKQFLAYKSNPPCQITNSSGHHFIQCL
ncbi:ArnT family glycosyltransferase [Candidatus Nitrosacidococcus tergens]|uniref:Glycosyltransferase RgtA/B/C/D-like domain-containing protein n=1 Tax=Candidatus Nitrosacidococcus tergens TaxID=553981 RepID=A0A7G1Q9B1_9GAMM|nr:hypothetical protein [Candidatus Nitrosacidococcus tergens]CAB1275723.1 membrane protein of unknown function [Candidatus Nitrosacidococcus tergens]